jgi:hypothetical protein
MSSGQLRVLELCSSVQQKTMNKTGFFQNQNSQVHQENFLANLVSHQIILSHYFVLQ